MMTITGVYGKCISGVYTWWGLLWTNYWWAYLGGCKSPKRENPIKVDALGIPPFQEASIEPSFSPRRDSRPRAPRPAPGKPWARPTAMWTWDSPSSVPVGVKGDQLGGWSYEKRGWTFDDFIISRLSKDVLIMFVRCFMMFCDGWCDVYDGFRRCYQTNGYIIEKWWWVNDF